MRDQLQAATSFGTSDDRIGWLKGFLEDLGRDDLFDEDRGPADVDGVACRKFAFVHGPGIVFTRSFDVATGRLVLTETDGGTKIREEGEIRSAGVRFPQRIVTVNTLPDGGTRTIRVTFSEITVNPELDTSVFAVPALSN
jgi:hypothetical protein